jgi:hypothetical protein
LVTNTNAHLVVTAQLTEITSKDRQNNKPITNNICYCVSPQTRTKYMYTTAIELISQFRQAGFRFSSYFYSLSSPFRYRHILFVIGLLFCLSFEVISVSCAVTTRCALVLVTHDSRTNTTKNNEVYLVNFVTHCVHNCNWWFIWE